MKLNLLSMNCRCVPSPQSNRTTSGPRLIATALTFRFGVGHDPEVPRNTTCMDPLLKGRGPLTPLDGVGSEGRCRVSGAIRTSPKAVYVQVPSSPRRPSRERNLDARRYETRGANETWIFNSAPLRKRMAIAHSPTLPRNAALWTADGCRAKMAGPCHTASARSKPKIGRAHV